jgi:hypothetical protein
MEDSTSAISKSKVFLVEKIHQVNYCHIDINISSMGIKTDTQLKILNDISLVLSQPFKIIFKDEDDSY